MGAGHEGTAAEGDVVARRPPGAYERFMRGWLRRARLVLLLVLPLAALGYVAYDRLPSGFMPAVDEGGFVIDYVAPPGTSLTETDRLLREVEAVLRATPE